MIPAITVGPFPDLDPDLDWGSIDAPFEDLDPDGAEDGPDEAGEDAP